MEKDPVSVIREQIDFECPICCRTYNDYEFYPMQICRNQHCCCQSCLDNTIFAKTDTTECFMCKVPIRKEEATRFRLLHEIREATMKIKVHKREAAEGEGLMAKSKE